MRLPIWDAAFQSFCLEAKTLAKKTKKGDYIHTQIHSHARFEVSTNAIASNCQFRALSLGCNQADSPFRSVALNGHRGAICSDCYLLKEQSSTERQDLMKGRKNKVSPKAVYYFR